MSIPPTMNVSPKNKKLYLGILHHLEELLGVMVRVGHLSIPPTMNITPKMKIWI